MRVCKVGGGAAATVVDGRLLPWVWLIVLMNLLVRWWILGLCRPNIIRIELPLHAVLLIIRVILHKAIFK